MALKFYPLEVKEIIHETDEAYTIKFDKPNLEVFQYLPGQYITVKVEIGGEKLKRAFSLSSSPYTDNFLSITIKAIPGGKVSNYLQKYLQVGDTLEVYPPLGNFTVKPAACNGKHYLLIGGGSGITPLMSILKSVLEVEPGSRVTLLYGNRDEKSIIFKQALENIAEHNDRLELIHVLSQPSERWTGLKGRIEGELLLNIIQDVQRKAQKPIEYYLCGPAGMMATVESTLKKLGVDEKNIHKEHYSALPAIEEEKQEEEVSYEIITRDVKVILEGKTYTVTVPAGESILDAAIAQDLDPPYACQEGVCSTCRAKLHSGLVQMQARDGLSDEELQANYILTCQSYPLTDDVVIEFA
ncbi:MAG: ferredoxin--NADP reductase [Bacteroidia bacterium]|nr:ferredoxin--NADP reductase [Bacteroidia bacterium]MDW8159669.1 ferredoxin--NADP reductase [Bacteroidia bacterium]